VLCELLDDDIYKSMKHAEQMCNIHKAHITPWTKSIEQATHSICYWDARITCHGIRDNYDPILDYYLLRSNVDNVSFDTTLTITTTKLNKSWPLRPSINKRQPILAQ
jgi:hypothetical protein